MTVRIPKPVLIGLGVVLVAGTLVAIYLTAIRSSETCFSEGGAEIDCGEQIALSEAEYAAHREEEAEERQEELEAERTAAKCEEQLGDTFAAAQELDSRLNVGLAYSEYGRRVGDIGVEYDQVPFKALDFDCVTNVGLPIERAFNAYVDADDVWGDCISDFGCRTNSIDPELQDAWLKASNQLDEADSGLRDLAAP